MFALRFVRLGAMLVLVCAAAVSSSQSARSAQDLFRGVRLLPHAVVHATSSDAFADGIAAVNTRFCDRMPGYTAFADPGDATVHLLEQAGFRHIRDGGTLCLGDSSFAAFASGLHENHAIDMLSAIEPCTSDTQIRDLLNEYPAIRAVEGPNEYDESKPTQYALGAIASGAKGIAVPADARNSFSIGQSYVLGEGPPAEPLTVSRCEPRAVVPEEPIRNAHPPGQATTLDEPAPVGSASLVAHEPGVFHAGQWITVDCVSHSGAREVERIVSIAERTLTVATPLRFDHKGGAALATSCLVTPNSYVSDLGLLYRRIFSVLHGNPKTAGIAILADSQAVQADNAAFKGSGIQRFEDIGNLHDYPAQRNPGGADGDGTKGFGDIVAGCGPYGAYWYNMCAESLQFGFAEDHHQTKPLWTTEVSYNVGAARGPWNAAQHPIPDDVAVKYLPRLELFIFATDTRACTGSNSSTRRAAVVTFSGSMASCAAAVPADASRRRSPNIMPFPI